MKFSVKNALFQSGIVLLSIRAEAAIPRPTPAWNHLAQDPLMAELVISDLREFAQTAEQLALTPKAKKAVLLKQLSALETQLRYVLVQPDARKVKRSPAYLACAHLSETRAQILKGKFRAVADIATGCVSQLSPLARSESVSSR